jgi:hypothetical protein
MPTGIWLSTGIHTIGLGWVQSVRHRSVTYTEAASCGKNSTTYREGGGDLDQSDPGGRRPGLPERQAQDASGPPTVFEVDPWHPPPRPLLPLGPICRNFWFSSDTRPAAEAAPPARNLRPADRLVDGFG